MWGGEAEKVCSQDESGLPKYVVMLDDPSLDIPVIACSAQVPNIKFNVAKMLERLAPLVDSSLVDQSVRPCLKELSEDPDADVRFYAKQALVACDAVTVMS